MPTSTPIIRVAIAAPLAGCFDYVLPKSLEHRACMPGMRVHAPFGRGQRAGIVVEVITADAVGLRDGLKPLLALPDEQPLLSESGLRLGQAIADYYHAPLGEVFSLMLPKALRDPTVSTHRSGSHWRVLPSAPESLPRARAQQAVLDRLRQAGGMMDADTLRDDRATLRVLARKGWVEQVSVERPKEPYVHHPVPSRALSDEQQHVVDSISGHLNNYACWLVHGVTGSGKTEVYLALMDRVLSTGRQVLVLVPEIALTPQLVARFVQRLADPSRLAVLHSGMTDQERKRAWMSARAGEARLVIGTRSAVFAELPDLGLIIVDEEHDISYKQQDGVRYHARDVAVMRAHQAGVAVVLGSATPSLESLANAEQGRYRLLCMKSRAGGAQMPRIEVVDARRQPMQEGLSVPVIDRIRRHLQAGGQVLLFLNRRGYAPSLVCHQCGHVEHCRHCSAAMTVHRGRGRLVCHQCGAERQLPARCKSCGSDRLEMLGQGTERLEDAVARLFPEFPAERIDRDTTRRKGELQARLRRAHSGEARILIGTQMLAKGHDFPGLTLSVVLDADRSLFSHDFRGPERLLQQIVQVAGRAGRASRPGEVLIQTHQPGHPLLQALLAGGFDACVPLLMHERRMAGLPPGGYLALVRSEARDEDKAHKLLERCRQWLQEQGAPVALLGPAPAPLERRAGRYRQQLLLLANRRDRLHQALGQLLPWLRNLSGARAVRWSVDVDPQDLG